ncbi:MAG TPA: Wzz/FepE/Etk N-terminal domain-containing protein [Acidobacteriaceae bacterium]|nr:Wzz/FepE/Etk N-terminal domain-containing protein [Acidobacteriaceae bacterium]
MTEYTFEQTAAAPSAVDEYAESIDLAALFLALRKEKRSIFAITLGVLALAVIVAFLLRPKYTSEASFIPPNLGNSTSSAVAALGSQLAGISAGDLLGGGLKGPGDLYAGILKSRSIADSLVSRFDLVHHYRVKKISEAEKRLASDTSVVVDARSTIVTLSVTSSSPQLAHDMATAYMEALRDTNGRLALTQASQRRLFFGQQLEQEKNSLEDAEVDLKKTEEQTGLIAPTGQTEAVIRTIADTQAQIAVRRVELAALRQSATDQNPEVIRLQSEIADLDGQLATLQRGKGADSGLNIPTSKVPQVQLDYVRKEREVKYHEALFEMLSRQFEAARLDEAREAPVLQVIDAASWPDTKSSPKRGLIALGGLIVGLIAGCCSVLARGPIRRLRMQVSNAGNS